MKFRRTAHRLGLVAALLVCGARPLPAQELPDAGQLHVETTQWLANLVRIDTTNPPGNEQAAARYIAGILEKEGITAELLEVAPGRDAVVARLRSSALPDPARALLLVGHLDVAGVERAKWTVDPFGGVIKEGYLYGRGAVEGKGMVVANMAALIALKRSGARLNRDVIFLGTTDEEASGEAGIKALIAKYWDKFAAGYALNEGGNVIVKDGKAQQVDIQASEKVPYNLRVVARGSSSRASLPQKDNPVVHVAQAIARIGAYSPPAHPTTVVRRYFEQIAAAEEPFVAKWIRVLDSPDRAEHAARVLSDLNPLWNAMLHDTACPTAFQTEASTNGIPAEARAMVSVRLLPSDSIDATVAELQKLVNDPQVHLELVEQGTIAAPPSALDNDFYQAIERVSTREFPGAAVAPFLSPWATDSAQLRLHSVQAYGLLPFPLTEQDLGRAHGDDERIPLDAFDRGVLYLYRIVTEFAVAK
jgi:acetylornithine deacetylase/succinyl-diaminopimelate desuccinylase-like protein